MPSFAVLAALSLSAASPALEPLAPDTPIHLGLALNPTHAAELAELQAAQQTPGSADYRRWLTPAEYGGRFGQPPAVYARLAAWLRQGGLEVREFPNHTFVEARGSASQVSRLLGLELRHVAGALPGVHVAVGEPRFPPELRGAVLYVAGLDTRVHLRRWLPESGTYPSAMGPQDLRRFYDLDPLLDAGYVGQAQRLAVLATAEPPASVISPQAIDYFLQNVSDARAPVVFDTLPNPQQDVDPGGGGNQEFQPDVELQSIGAPGAASITLVIPPASEVFTTGVNEIVSNLADTTAISISLGYCEQPPVGAMTAMRNLVVQGTLEGQTWSAASGDFGSNDCGDGVTESVDFPASIPEVVAMGGTQVNSPAFDAHDAIPAWQTEVVWSDPANYSAGGGGLSGTFAAPPWQASLGFTQRSVPDLALLAGNPGVAADSSNPFIGVPIAAQLDQFEGTSASSPLSAGIFALIASRLGCRLGDPHVALYAMGVAQFDGGPAVFHDVTSGTNSLFGVPGYSATVGFDSASGWGTLDVAALAAAWPGCPVTDGGGFAFDGGLAAEAPYDPCAFIGCDAGGCTTLPEGPSSCAPACGGA
ncbi:MAG TPA: S53 family peptidase, partial [Myxococcales bacterium]|nr:S53 family peptidase [Myxococcales bacterium]